MIALNNNLTDKGMKIIKPIVGISKIMDNYDAVISGFNGVLYNGAAVNAEALSALKKCAENGKKAMILSNSPLRVHEVVSLLSDRPSELSFLTAIITAGEILHYQLKNPLKLGLGGKRYYNLGGTSDRGIFSGLDYVKTTNISQADFLFVGDVAAHKQNLADYAAELEHACSLGLPLLCVGNDLARFHEGKEALGCGAIAEQYAVLGGKIITFGKPQTELLNYAAECLKTEKNKILYVGDSFASDIKSGNLMGADTVLVSKGIHVTFLGEGYIPDVEKARNLAANFDAYSDYVISGLRW